MFIYTNILLNTWYFISSSLILRPTSLTLSSNFFCVSNRLWLCPHRQQKPIKSSTLELRNRSSILVVPCLWSHSIINWFDVILPALTCASEFCKHTCAKFTTFLGTPISIMALLSTSLSQIHKLSFNYTNNRRWQNS